MGDQFQRLDCVTERGPRPDQENARGMSTVGQAVGEVTGQGPVVDADEYPVLPFTPFQHEWIGASQGQVGWLADPCNVERKALDALWRWIACQRGPRKFSSSK